MTVFEPDDVEGFGIQYYGFRDRLFKNLDHKMFIELKAVGPLTFQKFKADYYLMNSSDTVIINSHHYYVMDEYGNRRLKESNIWRFKLKALTEDCLGDFDFDQLQFSGKNIKKVVDAYNLCKDEK